MAAAFVIGMTVDRLAGPLPAGADLFSALAAVLLALTLAVKGRRRRRDRRAVLDQERLAWRDAEARMQHLTRHDALTGLLNRPVFIQHLERILDGSRHGDRMIAVMTLDIHDFKAINDAYGHAAGDLLLRHAGSRLLSHLRDTDVLARMGADEFAVVQNSVPNPEAASLLADRLIGAIEEPFDLMGQSVPVRVSVGIAMYPEDGSTPEVLLQRAGLALQRARGIGPGSAAFFEEGMDAEVRRRKTLERDLHQALERGELSLHYQPQVDLESRRIVGLEALARWTHPEHGAVPPDVFIALAEDCGLIDRIGAWALEEACAQARRWQQAGAEDLRMSVNLSPVQFRQPNLVDEIGAILERTGLDARHLELEITERVLIGEDRVVLESLARLRAMGVRISVDDFGAGHASLGYLQRFVFDEIKVDRTFIAALGRSASAAAILRAAVALSRSLAMNVVAEGVEDQRQLDLLLEERCPTAQGYFFCPPRPAGEIDLMVVAGLGGDRRPDEDDVALSVA
ncbi:MAG: EAL domain-containing protein [Geminicoccaceae bacterium]|nr:EAL domain-containing protein [Geminicoccaceae bacterium]